MTLLQLEYFQEIAKTQNMALAAQNLYVSQPAVSKALKKLEEELGGELFDRVGKSLELNEKGREFQKGVNTIFSIIQKNKSNMLQEHGSEEISIQFHSSEAFLAEPICRYAKEHPEVHFHFISGSKARYFSSEHTINFTFCRWFKQFDAGAYIRIPDRPRHGFLILPKDHPLSREPYVNYETLYPYADSLSFCVTLPNQDSQPPEYISLINWGIPVSPSIITDDRFTMLNLVLKGGMVAIAPYSDGVFIRDHTEAAAIPLYQNNEISADRPDYYYFTWSNEKPLSKAQREFLEFILNEYHLSPKNIQVK